jgi:NADPH:quinone reductase-like Zn-dependent oxidoreductase
VKSSQNHKPEIRMRAIIIKGFGGLDSLVIENLPDPVPQLGSVLIEVKAFGINHAETHMRKGERIAFHDGANLSRRISLGSSQPPV